MLLPDAVEFRLPLPEGGIYKLPRRPWEHGNVIEVLVLSPAFRPFAYYMARGLPLPEGAVPGGNTAGPVLREGTALAQIRRIDPSRRCQGLREARVAEGCLCRNGRVECPEEPAADGHLPQAQTGHSSVPTPFGRRLLPPARQDLPAREPTHICLADRIPTPPAAVTWEVDHDIRDAALAGHRLTDLDTELPLAMSNSAYARLWRRLPTWCQAADLEALFVFTDGSFFPGRTCASWSVVVFGQQQGTLCRVGVMAGPCVLFQIDAGPDHCPSAYDGELEALVHALAICALSSACICHVGADCSSALSVVMGFSGFRAEHRLPAAAVGLAASVMAQRRQLCAHKVDAHTGCLGNSLADELAKYAGRSSQCIPCSSDWGDLVHAVAEKVLERTWLLDAPLHLGNMPPLRPDGTWSVPNTVIREAQANPIPLAMQQVPTNRAPKHFQLRLLTYNVLSAKGATAQELLRRGLCHHRIDIAGFQETRERQQGVRSQGEYWVLSAPGSATGQGGVQIWLRKALGWDRRSFAIVHADQRILVVVCTLQGCKFVLASAHAPTATTSDDEVLHWWLHLRSTLARAPAACVPLLFIDANARFEQCDARPDTHDAAPRNYNATCLKELAAAAGLSISAQFGQQGDALYSWRSPKGKVGLLDYVCCPHQWAAGHSTVGNLDLEDMHAGHDHFPIHTCLAAMIETCQSHEHRQIPPAGTPDSQWPGASIAGHGECSYRPLAMYRHCTCGGHASWPTPPSGGVHPDNAHAGEAPGDHPDDACASQGQTTPAPVL